MTAATECNRRATFSGGAYVAHLMAELERAAISARIKQARTEAGMTQPELADAVSVHWRTVQQWESGSAKTIPFDRLGEIAAVTATTKTWLLHGEREGEADGLALIESRLQSLEAEVRESISLTREMLQLLRETAPPVVAAPPVRKRASG